MERNTTTKIYKLQIGDRFYKTKDRGRQVYEVIEAEKKVTAFRTYSYWGKVDGADDLTAFKGDTEVVFLRHNPTVPIPPQRRRIKASLEHYVLRQKMN